MLTEVRLRGRVREQAILLVPAQLLHDGRGAGFSFTISVGHGRIAKFSFHLSCVAKRFNYLQSNNRGTATLILRRHSKSEILAPIHKWPPCNGSYQAIGTLSLKVPVEHGARACNLLADKVRIVAVNPEIVHHTNQEQRESGNHLH